jgi:hypothetical protein
MTARSARPPLRRAGAAPTLLAIVLAGGAIAQTASKSAVSPPAAPAPAASLPPLPRAFAGYAQPAIPPASCRVVSAGEVDCQMPGMIAGRYVVETAGTSTAQAAGAVQVLQIVVADQVCGVGRTTSAWSSGARTFRFDCAVTLLSDRPVVVKVLYADEKAVKDPKGPVVKIEPLAWNGVLGALPFAPKQ